MDWDFCARLCRSKTSARRYHRPGSSGSFAPCTPHASVATAPYTVVSNAERYSDWQLWVGVPLCVEEHQDHRRAERDVENSDMQRKGGMLAIGARCTCEGPDTVLGARQYAVASHLGRRRRDPALPAPLTADILLVVRIGECHGRGEPRQHFTLRCSPAEFTEHLQDRLAERTLWVRPRLTLVHRGECGNSEQALQNRARAIVDAFRVLLQIRPHGVTHINPCHTHAPGVRPSHRTFTSPHDVWS
jgi:hypothetical protein